MLHRAYRFHAHSEDLAQGMDFGQFMRFCVQAKIVEPGVVDRTHLHRIFNAAAGHSPGDEGECRRHLRMGPTEWVQALVRMAFLKYAEEDAGLAIAARLELLIERCVAVHCAYPERGSQLFQTIRSVEIQQVIDKYRDLLTDVFNRYCTGAAYPPQLHEGEWKLLLMNCSLVDSTFTHNAVSQVCPGAGAAAPMRMRPLCPTPARPRPPPPPLCLSPSAPPRPLPLCPRPLPTPPGARPPLRPPLVSRPSPIFKGGAHMALADASVIGPHGATER